MIVRVLTYKGCIHKSHQQSDDNEETVSDTQGHLQVAVQGKQLRTASTEFKNILCRFLPTILYSKIIFE